MQIRDQIVPKSTILSGFNNSTEKKLGVITLPTCAEGMIKETEFQVLSGEMAYNVILGRPLIHVMEAVQSTLYQLIKFPIEWGIKEIQGEQRNVWDCYAVVVSRSHTPEESEAWQSRNLELSNAIVEPDDKGPKAVFDELESVTVSKE